MLFVRLLLIGGEDSLQAEVLKSLYSREGDNASENLPPSQLNGEATRASGPLRICEKKVKIECLTFAALADALESANNRYWSKVGGIVFLHTPIDGARAQLEFTHQKLEQKHFIKKYNYSLLLLESGDVSSSAKDFCQSHGILYSSAKSAGGDFLPAFQNLVSEINRKHQGSPRTNRRRSSARNLTKLQDNDLTAGYLGETVPSPAIARSTRTALPTATSEQVAEILSDSASSQSGGKKSRRRSFLDNLVHATGKKLPRKKRRESLLEGNDDASDSGASDDEGYSSSDNSASASIEEMEGFFEIENVLNFMCFSSSSARELVIENFLLCLPSFMSPLALAKQLVARWNTGNMKEEKALWILRNRLVNILACWLRVVPERFFTVECHSLLDQFIDVISKADKVTSAEDVVLLWLRRQPKPAQDLKPSTETSGSPALCPVSPRPPRSNDRDLPSAINPSLQVPKQFTPLEVASQLTLIEHSRFQRIAITEFVNAAWTTEQRDLLSPHLLHMIHHSTFITLWVQTLILSERDVKERARVIKWCISVAQKCRELSNYNSLMAIIGGLQSCPIDRLKRTWEEVGLKNRRKVEQLFDMMVRENYKEYRTILKACSGPCIPFPGMWLSDLQFIDCGNKWHTSSSSPSTVNLAKMAMVAKVFKDIIRLQETSYGLQDHADLQKILRSLATIDDEAAYQISTDLEPIASEHDREHKRLLTSDGELTLDYAKCAKFESKAHELRQDAQEMNDLLEKWNRKLRDDAVLKECLCQSKAPEILLIKFSSLDLSLFPQTVQRELSMRLSQFFSHCLVGDSSKHQQLLECLRRLQNSECAEKTELASRLIHCFKVPPAYRFLSQQLSDLQTEIIKTREQIELLDQMQVVADKDHKEHQVRRKRLELQLNIIQMQQRKEEFIKLKDAKKRKILDDFEQLACQVRQQWPAATANADPSAVQWTTELVNISKDMKATEGEYIDEKKKFSQAHEDITHARTELEQEKERLLEQLRKVERRLQRLDQKETELENHWTQYQTQFTSTKQSLVTKTDNLMGLIDAADHKHRTASYLDQCMSEFQTFFSSVLNLRAEEDTSLVTKQQLEQQTAITRDLKRFLQTLLGYLKYFEHALFQLREKWDKIQETLSAITKLRLPVEVLQREFPQYQDLSDQEKILIREAARLQKEFLAMEKHQLWQDQFLDSSLDEANRCHKSMQGIRQSFQFFLCRDTM